MRSPTHHKSQTLSTHGTPRRLAHLRHRRRASREALKASLISSDPRVSISPRRPSGACSISSSAKPISTMSDPRAKPCPCASPSTDGSRPRTRRTPPRRVLGSFAEATSLSDPMAARSSPSTSISVSHVHSPGNVGPEANRLLEDLPNAARGWEAVVIGEPSRAFYGSQFALTFPFVHALPRRAVGARGGWCHRPRVRGT